MILYITENINPNYNIIPGFVGKNPKITLKICVISKQTMWFSTASTSSSSYFSLKTPYLILFSFFCFLELSPFWTIQVTSLWSKTTTIQNSNKESSLIGPYLNFLVHPKLHTQLTPLINAKRFVLLPISKKKRFYEYKCRVPSWRLVLGIF
jgi:hypothetical protein